jgi:hypothetical protein
MTDTHGWTPERRARQAALIHTWKPWTASVGPRTAAGKAKSSQNVIVGMANREKALAQAKRELMAAMNKVSELTGKRGSVLDLLDMRIK